MTTILMTGATRGIGRVAAEHLARTDTHLVAPSSTASYDPAREARLWEVLEDLG